MVEENVADFEGVKECEASRDGAVILARRGCGGVNNNLEVVWYNIQLML